jgi:hypothetical protein
MIHELKTLPIYFEEVIEGRKLFEVRKNDRNFLASRISDLKKQGHKIKSEMVSVATRNGGRTHIAKYSWEEDNAKNDGKECDDI